ncbi:MULTISPECIES: dipicolinate synthase subunit DpsA [Lacrimispora]|jgi:dipicolinate synthase subunit A|uniref:dipicolinate synthase subunit DpsA n=1 Tax=Lacrimispora TaxID=2719231 RepID=UPI000BE29A8F|nr:dipicolinate synthase subunit DpsA [Lacrimispora amygdalina]MDK2965722.1 dipicolinate synthase subunit [Lacrimispora sp.]
MYKFLLLGGDSRQLYLSRILSENGFFNVLHSGGDDPDFSLKEAMENCNIILCPIPFTRDKISLSSEHVISDLGIGDLLSHLTSNHILFGGGIPSYVKEYARKNEIGCFDYMDMEDVTIKNTIATAEGAIAEAIRLSPGCLHQSKCLITGFGRCARTLALKLKGLDLTITIAGRKANQLALASAMGFQTVLLRDLEKEIGKYDYIFNTIPALVIPEELVSLTARTATIIDIASAPGGVDFDACSQQGIRAKLCLGLPGIYAPETSAKILYEAILTCLSETV